MLPQLTVYAKILYLLMVVISGALCKDVVLMTQCPRSKTIHLDYRGKVSITPEAPTAQNITLGGYIDFETNSLKTTLFVKDVQMYLCFNEKWKLLGEKKLHDRCYFTESDKHGFYEYSFYKNRNRKIQFFRRLHNKTCSHFSKIESDIYHVDDGHNSSSSPDTSNHNNNNNNNNNRNSISNSSSNGNHHRRHRHGSQVQQHPKRTRNNGNRRKKLRSPRHRRPQPHQVASKLSVEQVDGSVEKSSPSERSKGNVGSVSSSSRSSSRSSFSNVHDEYSNDDASAIVETPPIQKSSTESPQNPSARKFLSRSNSGSSGNSYDFANRKRITSSSLSSINNANFDRDNKYNNKDDDNADDNSSVSSSSSARTLTSRTKKYYNNKPISSLFAGSPLLTSLSSGSASASVSVSVAAAPSLQSTVVGDDQHYLKNVAAHYKSPAVITPDKLKKVRSRHRKKFQQRTS